MLIERSSTNVCVDTTSFKLIYLNVLADIKSIITRRRFETLTLHQLVQKLRIADCEWLGETADRRVCQTDSMKRTELLREFIYWFFDSFVMPLIKVSNISFEDPCTSEPTGSVNILCHRNLRSSASTFVLSTR
jgi:hypothetical protein